LTVDISDGTWGAVDGTPLPVRRWHPDGLPAGVMVCVHGLGGAVTDFDALAGRMAACGLVCAAPTVRGQGMDPDPRRRGSWMDPDGIGADIAAFVDECRRAFPGVPVFLCGESLGGLLCARCLARGTLGEIAGAVFAAPVVTLARTPPPGVRLALRVLARVLPRGRLRPGWLVTGRSKAPRISRDDGWIARQRGSAHWIDAFSFAALDAVGRLMEEMPCVAPGVRVPSLVLAAGADVFIRPDQIRAWFDGLGAGDKTFLEYPSACHVLWNDWDRERVLGDISAWLQARLPSAEAGRGTVSPPSGSTSPHPSPMPVPEPNPS
jgi:acylglycerol lipase